MEGAVGNLEPGNVCKSQAGCQEAVGKPGKSGREPVCCSLTVLEIISLHTVLGGESRERDVCAVAWGCSGHSLPLSPSCPPP